MTPPAIPLLTHPHPSAVVAYRAGRPIRAGQFLADAAALAAGLPSGKYVLNVCVDRYRFTVGLAACLMTGRVSLLPSTHTPEVIRQLAEFAPDAFCLTDQGTCTIELPQVRFPEPREPTEVPYSVPQVAAAQTAAIVFTSGSTGMPLPYHKTWGKLARCVQDGAPRLGLNDGRNHVLIGTVPPQHMYGFESTVLLALLSGNAFAAERPFYPADICSAVAAVPQPRTLISTPVHLRALLAAAVELPPVDLIVSATSPLAINLAHEVEATYGTRLLEIYGSTETGQIATRRTAEGPTWHLWPDVRLLAREDRTFAHGGHVEQMTPMCDVIEIVNDREFILQGRTRDLVNVAGKRSSIGYLNAQLAAVAGVVDGAFLFRDSGISGATGVARLAAVVVAPTLTADRLFEELRERIDPVFLPRPLLLVERLPRNPTGKLPLEALQALVEQHLTSSDPACTDLDIATDHPAFAGHFPDAPILPGAALLDRALHEIERSRGIRLERWQVASAKFLEVVSPGTMLRLEHTSPKDGVIRFVIRNAERAVVSGTLQSTAAAPRSHHGA